MKKLILTSIGVLFILAGSGQEPVFKQDCVKIVRVPWDKGRLCIYTTVNSKKQGYEIVLDSLGRIEMESCNVDDKWTGPFIIYYDNGQISLEGYVVDGLYEGLVYHYYHDGTLSSVTNFKHGNHHGIREEYTENGELDKRYLYQCDTLVEILEYNRLLPLPPGYEKYVKQK